MGGSIFISAASQSRIARARAWLEARQPAEEILILGANLDAANELARDVVRTKGAAFGWHRLSLAQLAAMLAAPEHVSRGLVSISPLGPVRRRFFIDGCGSCATNSQRKRADLGE
jgi:hypothetical protein